MRFPDDVPTLSTGDVTLRAHRRSDIPAIVEQCVDPISVRWTTVPLGYDEAHARSWVSQRIPEAWASEQEFLFAIEANHNDGRRRYGGSLSLRDAGDRRAEIAFGAHPGVRGRGVMTTAVRLLLDWGFEKRDLETVLWYANVGNVASRRVAWRTGFTFAGTMNHWLLQRGEYRDAWVATLHRNDPQTPATRWLDPVPLVGEAVRLRPFDEGDVAAIVETCNDPRTRRWLAGLPDPYTESDGRSWLDWSIEQMSIGRGIWWAVVDGSDGRLLGNVSLPRIGQGEGEVGYWTRRSVRGRGVMSAAVGLTARHALTAIEHGGLGLRRLTLLTAAGNVASQQVARANGFRQFGHTQRTLELGDGSFDDLLLFDLDIGRAAELAVAP